MTTSGAISGAVEFTYGARLPLLVDGGELRRQVYWLDVGNHVPNPFGFVLRSAGDGLVESELRHQLKHRRLWRSLACSYRASTRVSIHSRPSPYATLR